MPAIFAFILLFLFCCQSPGAESLHQKDLSGYPDVASHISNLNVKSFCQDSMGYMWIATSRGLNRYNGYEFLQYFHHPLDTTSIDNDLVLSLFLDSSHRLWVGTSTGVNCYNFKLNNFERYHATTGKTFYVCSFFEDHKKQIWVATQYGPAIIDTIHRQIGMQALGSNHLVNLFWEDSSQKLWIGLDEDRGLAVMKNNSSWDYFTLPDSRSVTCIYRNPQGIWWLGTNSGIVVFDPVLRTFRDPPEALRKNVDLNKTQINFIREISPLKLMIGTASQGFFLYDILSRELSHNEPLQLRMVNSNQLLSCYVDQSDNIWVGSFDKGFGVWNSNLDYFNADRYLSDVLKGKFVTRVVEDKAGDLWISTRYNGLYHYTKSGKLTIFNQQNSDIFAGDDYLIESLFIDSHDRIWIGLTDQLIVARTSTDGRIHIIFRKGLKRVGTMREDLSGNLWIGSLYGLYRIDSNDPRLNPELVYVANITDICTRKSGDVLFSSYGVGIFRLKPDETVPVRFSFFTEREPVAAKYCVSLYEDSQKRMWMGSYGNGLLYFHSVQNYSAYDRDDGLPSNDVLCFEEDEHGDMWMSTSNGISKLRTADTTFVNYFSSDGTLGDQYHEKSGLKHTDGRIFFTGNHGLTFFNPMAILPAKYPPKLNLSDLKISNKSVIPRHGSTLTESIQFTKQIVLNHRQTTLSIDYTGIDFMAPQKLTYAYKLEGLDESWNFVGNYRRATYSNLVSGDYIFKVKAINGEGQESLSPVILQINVKPAPWLSWKARVFYIMVCVTIIYFLFRLGLKKKVRRQMQKIEHSEREREKEITEMKMNFFTNISHELRTPLTLISAPLEQLMTLKTLDSVSLHLLNTISRNVQSMLRLINQLLDFRKMESGMMNLKVQQTDVIQFIRNVQDVFLYPAMEKQVTLEFAPHIPEFSLWVDTDMLEKILHNLLSNALKYTPPKGTVKVVTNELSIVEANDDYQQVQNSSFFEIAISDSGPGVPAEKFNELFVRYRQIEGPSGKKPDYGGSGIGLHYTKRLVETHHGKIKAKAGEKGGMVFSFILPEGDFYSEGEKKEVLEFTDDIQETAIQNTDVQQKHSYTILVAEDHVELMNFIRNLLESQYEVIEALNGTQAWTLTEKESPDLILSDVLMPGLSGYELCARVKQHPQFSHIPVILLTAKSTMKDQLEGLEQGADAYICKPFHVDFLLLTIKNLFMNRDRLRQYYSIPQKNEEEQPSVQLAPHDQKLMQKLMQKLEEELPNADLNIDDIARDLGFSRSGFYRKIRGLTDMSPIDFLRSYRLRRAAEMIREGALSLNDVASSTGFNFYPYFSKSFKKHFGVSPKEYAQL
jgi:signal transduction histidine kinase/ligand-binding sensor domain-containing protein/DNA-binding response OmpR family regulator